MVHNTDSVCLHKKHGGISFTSTRIDARSHFGNMRYHETKQNKTTKHPFARGERKKKGNALRAVMEDHCPLVLSIEDRGEPEGAALT